MRRPQKIERVPPVVALEVLEIVEDEGLHGVLPGRDAIAVLLAVLDRDRLALEVGTQPRAHHDLSVVALRDHRVLRVEVDRACFGRCLDACLFSAALSV